jgi:rSAM/selenodomain-associated transferase 1
MSRARAEACGIAVFARAPVAGAAKTRLIPLIGAEGAASLHAALLRRTLGVVSQARSAGSEIGEATLWCTPDASHPVFAACRDEFGISLRKQVEGDLGRRMHATFERQSLPLLLIGSDCPVFTPDLLRLCAAQLLGGSDAVFLPAEDGGYGLVGLARPAAALFENIAWSSASVMEETRQRLRESALTWSEPATIWDVDLPEDVERLIESGLMPEWSRIPR